MQGILVSQTLPMHHKPNSSLGVVQFDVFKELLDMHRLIVVATTTIKLILYIQRVDVLCRSQENKVQPKANDFSWSSSIYNQSINLVQAE